MFFRHGFVAATIEDIAAEAHVSKVTIYNRFGDKAALFEAMVREQSEAMAGTLDQPVDAGGSLEVRLNAFGASLMGFLFHVDHIALDRILAQEMAQHPQLAARFYAAGPGNCHARLTQVIADGLKSGALQLDDAASAADDLIALWKGFIDVQLKFGVAIPPNAEEIRRRVGRGTELFMRLYGSGLAQ